MKRLIITADDYGMSKAVNEAIEAGINRGVITSTNIMTNLDYALEAKELRGKCRNLSVGLHWNLTVGRPLTKMSEVKTLVDHDGAFFNREVFMKRLKKREIDIAEMQKEMAAQYRRFYELCGKPDYWNTHQNIHVDLNTFKLFFQTAKMFRINGMRSHRKICVNPSNEIALSLKKHMAERLKRVVIKKWMKEAKRNLVKAPHGNLYFLNQEDKFDITYFTDSIAWEHFDTAELVLHPATQEDSKYFGRLTDLRIREYNCFCNEDAYRLLSGKVALVSFQDI